jgi:hypothetical protein
MEVLAGLAKLKGDILTIPEYLGRGNIRRLFFNAELKITIHYYVLKEDLMHQHRCS